MSVEKLVLKSRNEWLEARKNHVGGSDASACVGVNPYKSNVELWEEKSGLRLQEDISMKDYVIYGIKAEEHLRELFTLDFPQYQVFYDDNNMFLNSDYPWMHASEIIEFFRGDEDLGICFFQKFANYVRKQIDEYVADRLTEQDKEVPQDQQSVKHQEGNTFNSTPTLPA